MKEFIEKLIGRLEEEYDNMITGYYVRATDFRNKTLEIVNRLAEEYTHCTLCYLQSPCEYQNEDARLPISEFADDNGWIPCSERLPEEHDSIFAKYKGTYKWNNAMFEKISDTVNVTVADENGNSETTYAHTVDGKWNCELLRCNKTYRIIAWRPLPEPYKAGEAE